MKNVPSQNRSELSPLDNRDKRQRSQMLVGMTPLPVHSFCTYEIKNVSRPGNVVLIVKWRKVVQCNVKDKCCVSLSNKTSHLC